MRSASIVVGAMVFLGVGCTPSKPSALNPEKETIPVALKDPAPSLQTSHPPIIALIEPYLVAVDAPERISRPPSLGGRILPSLPAPSPLVPSPPPTETRPLPQVNSPEAKPKTVTPPSLAPSSALSMIPAMVRLLDEERSRAVDLARQHLSSATARVTQTTAEAKKTLDLVRAGAVAQFKANQADAAVREATSEQADAQSALDDAQSRQRNARRDVEAALKSLNSIQFDSTQVQLLIPAPAFRPMAGTYRLSILGSKSEKFTVGNGTLGRSLPNGAGESGAWILRCLDPAKVQITVGKDSAQIVVRTLPTTERALPRV